MADDADLAGKDTELVTDLALAAIRNKAKQMAKGEPGDCALCGEPSLRLVNRACAGCRDKYKLP